MKKNKILCLILLTAMMALNLEVGYAASVSISGGVPSSGSSTSNGSSEPVWANYRGNTGKKKYQYRYRTSFNIEKVISINAYDMSGKPVIPDDITIDPNMYTFKSGTWIGINATEIQTASWGAYGFEYQEVKKKYICEYKKLSPKYCTKTTIVQGACSGTLGSKIIGNWYYCTKTTYCGSEEKKISIQFPKDYYEDFSCPKTLSDGYRLNSQKVEEFAISGGGSYENAMKQAAIGSVHKMAQDSVGSASGKLKYAVGNDYNKLTYPELESTTVGEYLDVWTSESSGYVQKSYEILQKKVCINVKNAKVSYGRDCTKDEIKVNNEKVYDKYLDKTVNYWHYFIPLNTKSNSDFFLHIIGNEELLGKEECLSIMEQKKNYQEYIIPLDDTVFTGDYQKNKRKSADYKKITEGEKKGCNISIKVKLPISQEFYNEVPDEKYELKFKGFNFYYKPIDIEEPFPNGIDKTSIWYDWNKKTIDFTKSYNEVTYIAQNINANSIREFTRDNPYTSWDNMYVNGVSDFIENQGIITRKVRINSFYNLGCGPFNADWSECKQ